MRPWWCTIGVPLLGFHWAYRNQERVGGIAYMEALVRPLTWDAWPAGARELFQGLRSPAGDQMVLEQNAFVEFILPAGMLRDPSDEEMAVYRRPYTEPGESRRPTLTWPREIPFEGEPADVAEIVRDYSRWLAESDVAKLFINGEPGSILTGPQREFCQAWPNQQEVTVPGLHYLQEDSPGGLVKRSLSGMLLCRSADAERLRRRVGVGPGSCEGRRPAG